MDEDRVRYIINQLIAEALERVVAEASANGDEFVRISAVETAIHRMGW